MGIARRLTALLLSFLLAPALHAATADGPSYPVTDVGAPAPSAPRVARQPDGTTLVVWLESVGTLANRVMARSFTATGIPLSVAQRVDDGSNGRRSAADVAGLPGGGFVLTWIEASGAVVARELAATALPVAPAAIIEVPPALNPTGPADAPLTDFFPSIATAADGARALAWLRCRVINDVVFLPVFPLGSRELGSRCAVLLRQQGADGSISTRTVAHGEASRRDLFAGTVGVIREQEAPALIDVGLAADGLVSVVWFTSRLAVTAIGTPEPRFDIRRPQAIHLARYNARGVAHGVPRLVVQTRDDASRYAGLRTAVDADGLTAVLWREGQDGGSGESAEMRFVDRAPLSQTRLALGIRPAGEVDIGFPSPGLLAAGRTGLRVETFLAASVPGSALITVPVDGSATADQPAVGADGSGAYTQVWRDGGRLFARGYRQP